MVPISYSFLVSSKAYMQTNINLYNKILRIVLYLKKISNVLDYWVLFLKQFFGLKTQEIIYFYPHELPLIDSLPHHSVIFHLHHLQMNVE